MLDNIKTALMPMSRSTQRFEGEVRAIPLGDGHFGFARALRFPIVEFYDYKSREIPAVEVLLEKPVAFRLWVMKYAFSGRRWKRISSVPLKSCETGKIWFFKQHSDDSLYRTRDGAEEIPASWDEAVGLERAAVWDPTHVEDRLRDYFEGRPNKWVESLRPRKPAVSS